MYMQSPVSALNVLPGCQQALTREQAEHIIQGDPELNILLLMELSAEVAALRAAANTPHAPSSSVPAYAKPATLAGRTGRSKRGAKLGHVGHNRPLPVTIDRTEEHALQTCPDCGAVVSARTSRCRTRIIEDIPKDIQSEVVEHIIPGHYCPHCKKVVEPKVPDALPNSQLGHRVCVLSAWLHFGLGLSSSQILQILNSHLHFKLSEGGLIESAHRIARILTPWYDQIALDVKAASVLNADETGWRVLGKTHWLWCFCSADATCYMIDESRGGPALSRFFTEALAGVLVTDFWAAYNAVTCLARQACLAHLFRELDSTAEEDTSDEWRAFHKSLKRLLRDAIRLKAADALDADCRLSRRDRLDARLAALVQDVETTHASSTNTNVKRLVKRLRNHGEHLFTFLDHEGVPSDNNHAEREIRPAVIMRKNILCNQSEQGAQTQTVLMTVFRTLRKRGLDPMTQIIQALRIYSTTASLPTLPVATLHVN
jgi:transposase